MNKRIDEAFRIVNRADFLPPIARQDADADMPLPIGYGQTNSQPSTVRWMLDKLDPQPGDKVLDVGSGSGWTSVLLAFIVGPDGQVDAVERIPQLVQFGRGNAAAYGLKNLVFYPAGDRYGRPESAPYNRILVSASAQKIPAVLIDQLALGGRLVVPVGHSIHVITKHPNGRLRTTTYDGFLFVPLV